MNTATALQTGRLDDQVTDAIGVLSDAEITTIEEAYAEVADDTGQVVFIHFTETFDGQSAGSFADELADASNLGVNNPLLVVAVEDGAYGVSADDQADITSANLDSMVADDVVPYLGQEDWESAAIAFGEGVADLDARGGFGYLLTQLLSVVVPILVLALVVYGAYRLYKRWQTQREQKAAAARELAKLPKDHPLRQDTEELSRRSGSALVEIDTVLRTSQEELAFAVAEFGLQRTDEFRSALEDARQVEREAFNLRKQVDDDELSGEQEQREAHYQVLQKADRVTEIVGSQKKKFQKLRNLQSSAPRRLDEMATRAGEVRGQLDSARARISALALQYTPETMASFAEIPDDVTELMDAVDEAVATGHQRVKKKDAQTAVTHLQIAEESLEQATALLKDVRRAGELLDEAHQKLPSAVESLESDIREAEHLRDDDAAAKALAAARDALTQAKSAQARRGDPLAALEAIEDAEEGLDDLSTLREQRQAQEREAQRVQHRLERVSARVEQVQDYINAHGVAVGHSARNLISEAQDLLEEARATEDAKAAGNLLRRADRLATSARNNAQPGPRRPGTERVTTRSKTVYTNSSRSSSGSSSELNPTRAFGSGCLGLVLGGLFGAIQLGGAGLVIGLVAGGVMGGLSGLFGNNSGGGHYSSSSRGGSAFGASSFGGGRSFGGGGGRSGGFGGGFSGGRSGGRGGRF